MSEDQLRQELYDSFQNRAMVYQRVLLELEEELGRERAAALLARAIEARGRDKGPSYARFAPDDFAGLRDAFLGNIPDEGRMFAPEVLRCDETGLDIHFHRCPLKEAWQQAGLAEEEVARLCRIAARVDNGMFEAAGFTFEADTYQPGVEGCCRLHVRPGPVAEIRQ